MQITGIQLLFGLLGLIAILVFSYYWTRYVHMIKERHKQQRCTNGLLALLIQSQCQTLAEVDERIKNIKDIYSEIWPPDSYHKEEEQDQRRNENCEERDLLY